MRLGYVYVRFDVIVGLSGECCVDPNREREAKLYDEHQASYEKAQAMIGVRCCKLRYASTEGVQ